MSSTVGRRVRKRGFIFNLEGEVSFVVMTAGYEVEKFGFWDSWSGGVGGAGGPRGFEPDHALDDVKDGHVPPAGADRDCGDVVKTDGMVHDEWSVDKAATGVLRRFVENLSLEAEYPRLVRPNAAWLNK